MKDLYLKKIRELKSYLNGTRSYFYLGGHKIENLFYDIMFDTNEKKFEEYLNISDEKGINIKEFRDLYYRIKNLLDEVEREFSKISRSDENIDSMDLVHNKGLRRDVDYIINDSLIYESAEKLEEYINQYNYIIKLAILFSSYRKESRFNIEERENIEKIIFDSTKNKISGLVNLNLEELYNKFEKLSIYSKILLNLEIEDFLRIEEVYSNIDRFEVIRLKLILTNVIAEDKKIVAKKGDNSNQKGKVRILSGILFKKEIVDK